MGEYTHLNKTRAEVVNVDRFRKRITFKNAVWQDDNNPGKKRNMRFGGFPTSARK